MQLGATTPSFDKETKPVHQFDYLMPAGNLLEKLNKSRHFIPTTKLRLNVPKSWQGEEISVAVAKVIAKVESYIIHRSTFPSPRPVLPVKAPVINGFCEMMVLNMIAGFQVGNGA